MQVHAHVGKKMSVAIPLISATAFLLVCTACIAGCGSSVAAKPTATSIPANTPIPTATPILNTTYTSPDGVYTFQFPGNWTNTPLNSSPIVNGLTLSSPDSSDIFLVAPLNTGIPASQYESFLQQSLAAAGGTSIKVSEDGTTTFGKNTWTVDEGTLTFKDTAYDAAQFALSHNGNSFFIIVLAPDATSEADGTTYFESMITSLTFLK